MHSLAAMDETTVTKSSTLDKSLAYVRQHPGISILAAAGIGLLGGVEVAAGVLFGAGIATLIGKGGERAVSDVARSPQIVRDRVRAIVQAARGKIAPA
jgi:hypothetical protein